MENEWTLSFNPNTGAPVAAEDVVTDLSPLVLSATMVTEERYEIVIGDEMSEDADMEALVYDVMQKIGEVYPHAVLVGHVDDEGTAKAA